jgi:hypothetical protein
LAEQFRAVHTRPQQCNLFRGAGEGRLSLEQRGGREPPTRPRHRLRCRMEAMPA